MFIEITKLKLLYDIIKVYNSWIYLYPNGLSSQNNLKNTPTLFLNIGHTFNNEQCTVLSENTGNKVEAILATSVAVVFRFKNKLSQNRLTIFLPSFENNVNLVIHVTWNLSNSYFFSQTMNKVFCVRVSICRRENRDALSFSYHVLGIVTITVPLSVLFTHKGNEDVNN